MARYLLVSLDQVSHHREYDPDLWNKNDKGKYVWTVEHIFPQGKNIPDSWVSMIADGDKDLAQDHQEKLVHRLGNLTLSGYNSRLSNQSFEKKQAKSDTTVLGHKIQIGYKNGLYLNQIKFLVDNKETDLSSIRIWNSDAIDARNKAMVEELCNLFRFEEESE